MGIKRWIKGLDGATSHTSIGTPSATNINPRDYQPLLPLPSGVTKEQILSVLLNFSIDGGSPGELANYAREDCERFLYTLDLVPHGPAEILEIGANPYFTTYLLTKFRPEANLRLINYFGGPQSIGTQKLTVTDFDEKTEEYLYEYLNANLEQHEVPCDSESFDVIIYAEVIEHLTNDPVQSLRELKRLLKPNGLLILTTPNVARLENVARILSGTNIYDPYSGYGPYGRHNREYTRHEIVRLLEYCGFTQEVFFTADVHRNHAADFFNVSEIVPLVSYRSGDLGQYLFSRWRNDKPMPDQLPSWLYRSYPDDRLYFSDL